MPLRFVALGWPTAGVPPLAADFPSLAAPFGALAEDPQLPPARAALRGALAGDAPGWPVYDPSLAYRRGRSPAALRDARYRIVPLMNRDDDVDGWSGWVQNCRFRKFPLASQPDASRAREPGGHVRLALRPGASKMSVPDPVCIFWEGSRDRPVVTPSFLRRGLIRTGAAL